MGGNGEFAAARAPADDDEVKRPRAVAEVRFDAVELCDERGERAQGEGIRRTHQFGGNRTQAEGKNIEGERRPVGKLHLPRGHVQPADPLRDQPHARRLAEANEINGDVVAVVFAGDVRRHHRGIRHGGSFVHQRDRNPGNGRHPPPPHEHEMRVAGTDKHDRFLHRRGCDRCDHIQKSTRYCGNLATAPSLSPAAKIVNNLTTHSRHRQSDWRRRQRSWRGRQLSWRRRQGGMCESWRCWRPRLRPRCAVKRLHGKNHRREP